MDSGMRTPLARVRGLGSAREGARDWWQMRLLSLALVPLALWWVVEIVAHAGAGYAGFVDWVRAPVPAILLLLTLAATFRHIALGLREVIEDYVHHELVKLAALAAVRLGCAAAALAGAFAVLRIALEG
ncbi:MAG TPA: succinate dehydrogenase, hydrophobic membrane anchor protein [Stellaceae bacterium]|nr:succinate dehydrogenase, hydrophobic membrane anchor protein [Stellaceae bacterium]